jgi:hypothetical protein
VPIPWLAPSPASSLSFPVSCNCDFFILSLLATSLESPALLRLAISTQHPLATRTHCRRRVLSLSV